MGETPTEAETRSAVRRYAGRLLTPAEATAATTAATTKGKDLEKTVKAIRSEVVSRIVDAERSRSDRNSGNCVAVPKLLKAVADGKVSAKDQERLNTLVSECQGCADLQLRFEAAEKELQAGLDDPASQLVAPVPVAVSATRVAPVVAEPDVHASASTPALPSPPEVTDEPPDAPAPVEPRRWPAATAPLPLPPDMANRPIQTAAHVKPTRRRSLRLTGARPRPSRTVLLLGLLALICAGTAVAVLSASNNSGTESSTVFDDGTAPTTSTPAPTTSTAAQTAAAAQQAKAARQHAAAKRLADERAAARARAAAHHRAAVRRRAAERRAAERRAEANKKPATTSTPAATPAQPTLVVHQPAATPTPQTTTKPKPKPAPKPTPTKPEPTPTAPGAPSTTEPTGRQPG